MAYWRGDSSKARLQRIYATAFDSKDELNKYLEELEEAKNRDHNKLGRERNFSQRLMLSDRDFHY